MEKSADTKTIQKLTTQTPPRRPTTSPSIYRKINTNTHTLISEYDGIQRRKEAEKTPTRSRVLRPIDAAHLHYYRTISCVRLHTIVPLPIVLVRTLRKRDNNESASKSNVEMIQEARCVCEGIQRQIRERERERENAREPMRLHVCGGTAP